MYVVKVFTSAADRMVARIAEMGKPGQADRIARNLNAMFASEGLHYYAESVEEEE